jgi:hypothetical protein
MGINNIRLSPSLLAALYPDSLVLEKIQENQFPAPTVYRYLGNHLRKISFLVHYSDAVFLPDDQLEFLGRMLSPCHLGIADVSVLNTAGNPVEILELSRQLRPETLFICGIDPASLGIQDQLKPFTVTTLLGISMLLLPSLNRINQETTEARQYKKQLWLCLQKLFSL